MDLFDFFYPQQAQAGHLNRIADSSARLALRRPPDLSEDIDGLRRENRDLKLYLTSLIQLLVDKGTVRMEEIQAKLNSLLPTLPPSVEQTDLNPFANLRE